VISPSSRSLRDLCFLVYPCGLERLLNEGGERHTIVPHGLHTITGTTVPGGWHTVFATVDEFTGIFLPPPFHKDIKATDCLFPCLQGMADALLGMAMTMSISQSILHFPSFCWPRPALANAFSGMANFVRNRAY
jgi:hypothetical protein